MNTELKPVEERNTLDLLELVCQLHSRALNNPRSKNMHDAYVEARQEMERRIKVNNNFVLADVNVSLLEFIEEVKYMMHLYGVRRYTHAEQTRNELSEKLDDIMRLGNEA
tara:strand:- start:2196 stop:2525 length:330 start_codon:yes stop_codon:yes gene_type:complete